MAKTVKAAASWNMKEKLYEDLLDASYAAAYVNDALLEGDEVVFKTAVADVIRARGVGKVLFLYHIDCGFIVRRTRCVPASVTRLRRATRSSGRTFDPCLRRVGVSLFAYADAEPLPVGR